MLKRKTLGQNYGLEQTFPEFFGANSRPFDEVSFCDANKFITQTSSVHPTETLYIGFCKSNCFFDRNSCYWSQNTLVVLVQTHEREIGLTDVRNKPTHIHCPIEANDLKVCIHYFVWNGKRYPSNLNFWPRCLKKENMRIFQKDGATF